jgi:hypothetical protein
MNLGTNTMRLVAGWLIITAWSTSIILDGVMKTYDIPPTVHGLMLLVAGALFGPTIAGRKRNGNGS